MTAAIRIDDDHALDELDRELDEDAPELRELLRETPAGQKILLLMKQARELVTQGARVNDNAAPEAAPPAMVVEVHRQDDFELGCGEVTVTLNGHVLWQTSFALMSAPAQIASDTTPEQAEEGGKLFAETLRAAIAGKAVAS